MKTITIFVLVTLTACETAGSGEPAPACRWTEVGVETADARTNPKACSNVTADGSPVRTLGTTAESESVDVYLGQSSEVLLCGGERIVVRPCE